MHSGSVRGVYISAHVYVVSVARIGVFAKEVNMTTLITGIIMYNFGLLCTSYIVLFTEMFGRPTEDK